MTVTMVGEVNPYSMSPSLALDPRPGNASGGRLMRILGLGEDTYLKLRRVNLCRGSWKRHEAGERWDELLKAAGELDVFVALGNGVAAATRCGKIATFGSDVILPGEQANKVAVVVVRLPHPSGRCVIWNDPRATQMARQVLRAVAPEIPWGEVDRRG